MIRGAACAALALTMILAGCGGKPTAQPTLERADGTRKPTAFELRESVEAETKALVELMRRPHLDLEAYQKAKAAAMDALNGWYAHAMVMVESDLNWFNRRIAYASPTLIPP